MNQTVSEGYRYLAVYAEGVRLAGELMENDCHDVLEPLLQGIRKFNEERCSPPKAIGEIYDIAYRCIKEAAKKKGDESDVKRKVLDRLSSSFHIFEEAWGTHWSDKRVRIDAIVTPKDDSQWKTKSPRFGIEFKNFRGFDASFSIKDYTKWWSQCHDYAETKFDDHGYVPVFAYNGFCHYRQRINNPTAAAFAVRFWGRLGVGELRPDGLVFVMNGGNKVWSEQEGVIDGRRISMERKFGSR